jgi:hypothetical protein
MILNKKYKTYLLASISLLFSCTLKAQSFLMSSVGIMPGTSSNATAVNFRSNSVCIDVQSGIAVFNGARSFGEFAINCDIKQQFNSLGITMFPNPARTVTRVRFINTPPLSEVFSLSVWSTDGAMISSRKETGYSIFQSVLLDVSNLSSGTYVLKIESAEYVDALKFIKAN